MSERNKTIARRYIDEAWNKGNLDVMAETHGESYQHHDPHDPWKRDHGPGTESVKKLIRFYRTAFPDLHLTIDEIIAEGDVVVARFSSRGTHIEEIAGHKPTKQVVKQHGVFWWRFEDGKIVESRPYWDAHGFMQQIGAIPGAAKVL